MRKKTYEEIKEVIESVSDCKLLTTKGEYVDTHSLIMLLCSCGNEFSACSFKTFVKSHKCCSDCLSKIQSEKTRKDGQTVYDLFLDCGLLPQFKPEDYINSKIKLPYICINKPDKGVQHINYDNVKQGRRCGCCRYDKTADKTRLDGNIAHKMFIDKGFVPEFDPSEYRNYNSKLPYRCKEHPEEIQYTTCSNLKKSIFLCKHCKKEKIGIHRRKEGQVVYDAFLNKNFQPLFLPSDYKNNYQKLPCFCINHPTNILYRSLGDINKCNGCTLCGYDRITGENHYYWKGGITPIHNHLRSKIYEWKIDSLKSNNYKCIFTNSKVVAIHHRIGFSTILKEIMDELSLPILKNVAEYSDEQMKNIENLCMKKHYENGLGTPINVKLHELFHSEYGHQYNTVDEFDLFSNRLKLGEFDEFLKKNNLKLII